jgi:hypothetical protein
MNQVMRYESLVVAVVMTSYFLSGGANSFAVPPSFPQQEIIDKPFDLLDMRGCFDYRFTNISKCYIQSSTSPSRAIDMKSITYVSDGKFLNATLWMIPYSGFSSSGNESKANGDLRYGAYIDTDLNNRTGWNGVDYEIEVMGESNNSENSRILLRQLSSFGSSRILQNASIDYDNNKLGIDNAKSQKYLLFSINLVSVGFPDTYKIMFYTQYGNDSSSDYKFDFSSWITIPPPTFSLVTNPNPEIMRPIEKKMLYAQLKTSSGTLPEV